MNLPRVGNLKSYLLERWRRTTIRKLERIGSGTASQLTELSEESTEETKAFMCALTHKPGLFSALLICFVCSEHRRHSFTEAQKKEIITDINNRGETVIAAGTVGALTSLLVDYASVGTSLSSALQRLLITYTRIRQWLCGDVFIHSWLLDCLGRVVARAQKNVRKAWAFTSAVLTFATRSYWDPTTPNISPSPPASEHAPGFSQAVKKRYTPHPTPSANLNPCPRIIRLLHKWIERFPFDFALDEHLQTVVREFVQKLTTATNHEKKWGEIILKALQEAARYIGPVFVASGSISVSSSSSSISNSSDSVPAASAASTSHLLSSSSSTLSTSNSMATTSTSQQATASPPIAKKRSKPRGIMFKERMSPRKMQFLDLDTKVLAKQMSLFDHKQLRRVVPNELVCNNWSKGKGEHVIAIRERNNLVRLTFPRPLQHPF